MSDTQDVAKIESWVLDTCRDLGLPVGGGEDDFFDAGGTSLTAMKLISRAETEFGEDALPPDDLFSESTLREIALSIQRNGRLESSPNGA